MEKFKILKLSAGILKAIETAGFTDPSAIQEKAIPLILEGKDIIGSSATGSGKTLEFGAGIIEKSKKGHGVQALVLTPTRELAEQVARSLREFSRHFGLTVSEVYGGVSFEPQKRALLHTEIVVGTPGRILDHLNQRTLNLSKLKFLVLDEADRMLDMGFIPDVEEIIGACPSERQTLLFSATIFPDIERIARKYMKNPVRIEVDSLVDPSKLHQVFYDVPQHMKFSLLVNLLKRERSGLVMVFCNTRRNTDLVTKNLLRYKVHALAIHGGLAQAKRTRVINEFHSHGAVILVCTDVAARGLDIKGVSHVYNYDVPKTRNEYVHRIGRTARAGKEGIAVSLVSQRDYDNFRQVCSDRTLNIMREQLPELEVLDVNFKTMSSDGDFSRGNRGNFRGRSGGFERRGYSRPREERGREHGFRRRENRDGGSRNFSRRRDR